MKMRTVISCAACAVFVLVSVSSGQRGSSFTSPLSGGRSFTNPVSGGGYSPTTPASTYRNSLVPSRSSFYNYNQNLVVEGNVGGGRQFRGGIPYSSRYEFSRGTDLNTISPVDSFIRRSASSPYLYDRSPGRIQSFYLPRRTVTSVMRGNSSGLVSPIVTFPGGTGRFAERKALVAMPVDTSGIYRPRSTLSMSVEELDRLSGRSALRDAFILPTDDMLANSIMEARVDELAKAVVPSEPDQGKGRVIDESLEPVKPLEPEMSLTPQTQALKDILDKEAEALEQIRERMRKREVEPIDELEEIDAEPSETEEQPKDEGDAETPAEPETGLSVRQRAKAVLGEHKTFESLARAKYEGFVASGDELLKEGKYYKAINAFVLASVWDSRSPEAYLHRAVAHFAAGEYMSSSLFLRRAMLISPKYAKVNIDLAGMIGDRDVIDNRIIEGVDWQKKSDSGEIAFLLAYVYYQQGKLTGASEYIEIAAEKMAGNEAVESLKEAIGPAVK